MWEPTVPFVPVKVEEQAGRLCWNLPLWLAEEKAGREYRPSWQATGPSALIWGPREVCRVASLPGSDSYRLYAQQELRPILGGQLSWARLPPPAREIPGDLGLVPGEGAWWGSGVTGSALQHCQGS